MNAYLAPFRIGNRHFKSYAAFVDEKVDRRASVERTLSLPDHDDSLPGEGCGSFGFDPADHHYIAAGSGFAGVQAAYDYGSALGAAPGHDALHRCSGLLRADKADDKRRGGRLRPVHERQEAEQKCRFNLVLWDVLYSSVR